MFFIQQKVGAEFENEALTMTYYRDENNIPVGIDREEVHLNISAESPEAGQEYAELKRLSLIEAKNYEKINNIEADITNSPNKFGSDYFLCDTVTVFNKKFNFQANIQVIGITKSHSSSEFSEVIQFGEGEPTILQKIKRDINNR
jgi:hypothetical protein